MRSIPTITKNLLIINVLAFIAYIVLKNRDIDINDIFGLHFFLASKFHIYQLFTYMFMHGGWEHLFFNMFTLWMFGCVMERVWGPRKFLFYYILCGLGAGLIQEISQYVNYSIEGLSAYEYAVFKDGGQILMSEYLNLWTTVGASGAIYGILLAFGMTFAEERMFIFPLPVPIKAKWFIMGSIAIELFLALQTSSDHVAHFAHLGGMLFGFILIKYWQKHPDDSIYGRNNGKSILDRMRENWEKRNGRSAGGEDISRKSDWDYNADKKATEEKVDKILDKIRKNGYGSLTEEEKKFLFDSSNKNKR